MEGGVNPPFPSIRSKVLENGWERMGTEGTDGVRHRRKGHKQTAALHPFTNFERHHAPSKDRADTAPRTGRRDGEI